MHEDIQVTGRLKVDHYRDGVLIQEGQWRDNIVTKAGKNSLASLLNSTSQGNSVVTHMGFGTSTTAVSDNDVSLGTELVGNGYGRVLVTRSNPSSNIVQYVATLTNITASTTIQEAGLFNQVSGGTLFAHQLTGAVALSSAADSLQVTWQVSFT